MKHPPDFNLLMLRGTRTAITMRRRLHKPPALAHPPVAQRVPIQIPVLTSMGGTLVEDEATMWSRRHRPT